MFSHIFLAVTPGELAELRPPQAAFMACHFSVYGKGLSNLPQQLPNGSMILLDDSTPPCGHDPQVVCEQLKRLVETFAVKAILLDFQGVQTEEHTVMAKHLTSNLPCPVAVTAQYAKTLGCPVFLAPPAANQPLNTYLAPWLKQGVYLEIAPMATQITVTESGSTSLPISVAKDLPLADKRLLCHYNVEIFTQKVVFTLQRAKEDLIGLVQQANNMGVFGCIGLYQELKQL